MGGFTISRKYSDLVLLTGVLILALLLNQFLFYGLQKNSTSYALAAVKAAVDQENEAGDPYQISRRVESLESFGVLRCIQLHSVSRNSEFLNTTFRGNCSTDFFNLAGYSVVETFTSVSGEKWRMSFIINNGRLFETFLWVSRFVLLLLLASAQQIYRWRLRVLRADQEMEIAKERLLAEGALMREELAVRIAHDIRSPLSALNLVVGLLDQVPAERLSVIRNASRRINEIAKDLLSLNKGDRHHQNLQLGRREENLETLDIVPILADIWKEKKEEFSALSHIQIVAKMEVAKGVRVKINKVEFQRTISNLINNAIESIESSGEVKIIFDTSGAAARIAILDNGKGIPKKILESLGDRKVSYGKDKGLDAGNGFGTFHAARVIRAMGGTLKFESKEGSGTKVTIELPLSK